MISDWSMSTLLISYWLIQVMLIPDWLAGSDDDKMSSSLESMREAALSIYQEYLSDKANPRIELDESLNKKLLLRIRSETPDPTWFDEVGKCSDWSIQEIFSSD